MQIFVMFNLKPGADPLAYEEWARANDIPGVNALKSVRKFSVHRATGVLGSENAPLPYAYIEIIDVADPEMFGADVGSGPVQELAGQFRQFADDPVFLVTEQL